jgi:hypothetical protein
MEIERLRSRLKFYLARAERAGNDGLRQYWLDMAKAWEDVIRIGDPERRRLSVLEFDFDR